MTIVLRAEAEVVEEAHRILQSLISERQQLKRRPDASALVEANRIAIEYWRGVIAEKLRSATR